MLARNYRVFDLLRLIVVNLSLTISATDNFAILRIFIFSSKKFYPVSGIIYLILIA